MIIPRKITATVMTFAILAGCVGAVKQEQAVETVPGLQLTSIILEADGISRGADQTFRYGTDKATIIAMLETFGPVNQYSNGECGAGPMVAVTSQAVGLTLNFQENRMVGWFYDGDGKLARTDRDVTTGTMRAALEQAMSIEMQPDSTLGIEFFSGFEESGFIGGFLSDESENAIVESLYSGTTCFFR